MERRDLCVSSSAFKRRERRNGDRVWFDRNWNRSRDHSRDYRARQQAEDDILDGAIRLEIILQL